MPPISSTGIQTTNDIVEEAQQEAGRRRATNVWVSPVWHPAKYDRVALWFERVEQATSIAQGPCQGLGQATAGSVEALEAVLHSQSWDHRVVSKMHSDKLREMESEPEVESNLDDYGDREGKGPKWQKLQRVGQVESAQGRLKE